MSIPSPFPSPLVSPEREILQEMRAKLLIGVGHSFKFYDFNDKIIIFIFKLGYK